MAFTPREAALKPPSASEKSDGTLQAGVLLVKMIVAFQREKKRQDNMYNCTYNYTIVYNILLILLLLLLFTIIIIYYYYLLLLLFYIIIIYYY